MAGSLRQLARHDRTPRRPKTWGSFATAFLALGLLVGPMATRLDAQDGSRVPPPTPPRPVLVERNVTVTAMPVPPAPAMPRFQFTVPPNTPLKELLPVPPRARKGDGPALGRSLADVPEINFQEPLARTLPRLDAMKQTAHTIAKVNHLNAKQADGFLEALRGARPDLAGLPFAMGDACRTKGEASRQLTLAVATVRAALRPGFGVAQAAFLPVAVNTFVASGVPVEPPAPVPQPVPPVAPPLPQPSLPQVAAEPVLTTAVEGPAPAKDFWERYTTACVQEDKQIPAADRAHHEAVRVARIAALMQVLAPEAPALRLGLVKYLAATSHVEATRALARLAVFSEEDEVRQAAVAALKVRRERDYTDILLSSLHYPWPAVARRGADALVKLERTDLVPRLVDLLDEPDPRAPVRKDGQQQLRELVRVNHHRNCLLCHAPGNTPAVSPNTLTAAVPVPSDPLPSPSDGYQTSSPDLLVRIDVTYLRPDFSVMQAVADAHPWPEMQRFDFLVRTREVSDAEAAAYREKLTPAEPGRLSPYHRAAVTALRELTGRDAAPTAEAWRRLLELPKGG